MPTQNDVRQVARAPAPIHPNDWHRTVRRVRLRAGRAIRLLGGSAPEGADEKAEGPRVAAWERHSETPLAVLAVLFLLGYAIQVLAPHLSQGWSRALNVSIWAIWICFAVDFVARVYLARRRTRYVLRHIVDLVIIGLPMLRPLRILRLVMLLRMINRKFADTLRGRVVLYGAFTALLLILCASLGELQAERGHHGANIGSFGDSLWWSIVTICTVGYGDTYPVTTEGRFIAAALMISGVGLFGVVTASFAAWLVDQLRVEESESQAATQRDLEALQAQLDRIEAHLSAAAAAPGAKPASRRRP